jgi:hypothetical protein
VASKVKALVLTLAYLESDAALTVLLSSLSLLTCVISLTIHNFSTHDFFSVFYGLIISTSPVAFPKLTSFRLDTEAIECVALHSFLLPLYGNLQHIRIYMRKEECMDAWLAEFAKSKAQLRSLQSIHLNPGTKVSLSFLLTLIKSTSVSLSSFTILGRRLWTREEAMQVIGSFPRGDLPFQTLESELRSLRITVNDLSLPFLDLLARRLPRLEKLALCVYQTVGSAYFRSFSITQLRSTHRILLWNSSNIRTATSPLPL